jgi:ribosomal protein S18 acetylase RimI-like enzyme
VKIIPATSPDQLRQVRQLFEAYAASLSFDLCFQNFQQELDGLPGCYAPPGGGLWLAVNDRLDAAGCVALRGLESGIGEMKRLYVRPEYRGTGLGRLLARTVLEEAAIIGYKRLRLDTTPTMTEAIRLYESLGFTRIAPYRANPVEGAICMEIEVHSQTQLQVVQVTTEQVGLVAPLFDAYRQFYEQPPDLEGARRFLAERLDRGESVILAVIEEGKALGFTQLYPSFSSVSMKPIWTLNDLFVAEEARRRCVGAALLRAARGHALGTGAARLALSTAVTNTKAQALYEQNGWRRDTGFLHYEYELPREGRNTTTCGER